MDLGIAGIEDAQPVGAGSAAVVYAAWQPAFGRKVAVKVFAADADPERVERERLAIGPLSDSGGVVPVHGAGVTADGRRYLLMAFMPGGSLADRVRDAGPLSPSRTAEVGVRLARAVVEAHRHGIRHRDIKPQNILFDRADHPRLADFGIADLGPHTFRTFTDTVSGTVSYVAPEVIRGEDGAETADLYSLAATLYFAVEGRHLFPARPGESYEALVYRRATAAGRVRFTTATPPWLQRVLQRALAPDPAQRYASAEEFAEELREAADAPVQPAVADRSPTAAPSWSTHPSGPAAAVPRARIRRAARQSLQQTAAGAITAILVLAAGLLIVAVSQSGPPAAAPEQARPVAEPGPGDPARAAVDHDDVEREKRELAAAYTERTQAAEYYRKATKAAPGTVLTSLGDLLRVTDEQAQAVRFVFTLWDQGLPPEGRARAWLAGPGEQNANLLYQVDRRQVKRSELGPVDASSLWRTRRFSIDPALFEKIPRLAQQVEDQCDGAAANSSITEIVVDIPANDTRVTITFHLVGPVSGRRARVEYGTDGEPRYPGKSCTFT